MPRLGVRPRDLRPLIALTSSREYGIQSGPRTIRRDGDPVEVFLFPPDALYASGARIARLAFPQPRFRSGEGRPLLYLHPAGGVRWTRVLEGLATSFALHVPVVPGFDGTGAHGTVTTMRGLAALVGEFVEKVIAGPCDVVGCSFGGYLATWLAAERPNLVDHLVLECPAGFRPKGKGERPADAEALRKLLFLHPEKLPPESKPVEQEAANRKMLPHYGATLDTTRNSSRACLPSTGSRSSFTEPPTA